MAKMWPMTEKEKRHIVGKSYPLYVAVNILRYGSLIKINPSRFQPCRQSHEMMFFQRCDELKTSLFWASNISHLGLHSSTQFWLFPKPLIKISTDVEFQVKLRLFKCHDIYIYISTKNTNNHLKWFFCLYTHIWSQMSNFMTIRGFYHTWNSTQIGPSYFMRWVVAFSFQFGL